MSAIVVELPEFDPQTWAETHFGDLDLGQEKRNQRAVRVATATRKKYSADVWKLVRHAGGLSVAHPEVTPDEVQATHRELTRLVPDTLAEASGLSEFELDVLAAKTNRTLMTVREVALAMGRLADTSTAKAMACQDGLLSGVVTSPCKHWLKEIACSSEYIQIRLCITYH